MAGYQLRTLYSPNGEYSDSLVDIVAVGGGNDTSDGLWSPDIGFRDSRVDIPGWFKSHHAGTRYSVFTYNFEDICLRPGLRDTANYLLESLRDLRKPNNENHNIIFVAHDIGGIVVKEALLEATAGSRKFQNIIRFCECLVFLHCPHHSHGPLDIYSSLQRLFQLNMASHIGRSPTLLESLANVLNAVNQDFLDSQLKLNSRVVNISNSFGNMGKGIFEYWQTSWWTPGEAGELEQHQRLNLHYNRPLQEPGAETPSPVALSNVFSEKLTQLPVVVLPTYTQITDTAVRRPYPTLESLFDEEPFKRWAKGSSNGLLVIHDEINPVDTAVATCNHILGQSSAGSRVQFYEFRKWDCRYDSVELMLSAFLRQLQGTTWMRKNKVINQLGLGDRFPSQHRPSFKRLLSTFFQCLQSSTDLADTKIFWILVNFDEHIESQQWVLSQVMAFMTTCEANLSVVLVNRCLPLLPPRHHFGKRYPLVEIITKRDSDPEDPRLVDTSTAGEIAGDSFSNVRRGQVRKMVLEIVAKAPGLFTAKDQLLHILLRQEVDSELRLQLVLLSWTKSQSSHLAVDSLNDLVSASDNNVFSRSLQPTSQGPERENQVNTALKLLLHCIRSFTVAELRDLEETTTYGQQIRLNEAPCPGHDSATTIELLPGLVIICENQVMFGHAQLRDYLLSQSEKDTEGGGTYRAHAQIADWCLQYLHAVDIEDWPVVNTDYEINAASEYRGSFRSYAVRHWVEHARLAGPELSEWPAFDELLNKPVLLEHWTNAYWAYINPATRGAPASMTTLAIFARHGADIQLSATMSKFQGQTSFREQCFGALSWAALEGQLSAVSKLAAIPRPDGTTLDHAILGAITSSSLEVIHKVVNLAAQEPITLRDPLAILGWAAYYDLVDIVKILIHTVPAGESRRRGFLPVIMCAAGSFRRHTGGSECLKLLINAKFAAESADDKASRANELALILACRHGNRAIALVLVEALCNRGLSPAAKNDGDSEDGRPTSSMTKDGHNSFLKALQTAITYGQHAMVEELLEFALAKGWRDTSALNPLCNVAVHKQRAKSLRAVISHLTNTVDGPRMKGIPDFLLHAIIKLKDESLVQQVINWCWISDAMEFFSILGVAVDSGDTAEGVVKVLIEKGERLFRETSREHYDDAINNAFSIAVRMGHLALLELILKKGPSLRKKNVDGFTPLFQAAWSGHQDIVQILVDANADLNAPGDEEGWTALQGAYDEARISEILLEAGAEVDRETTGGNTALTLACVNDCVDTIAVLLRYKANPNHFFNHSTPLSLCLESSTTDGISKLLEAGADPTLVSASDLKHPLLHYCVRHGLSDALELLLLYNISVNELDDENKTALCCITSQTTVSSVKLLLRRGASVDPKTDAKAPSHTPLLSAVSAGNYEVAEYLVSSGANVNAKGEDFGSILHAACRSGTQAIIGMLVEAGADINYKYPGEDGTPLHAALRNKGGYDDRMEIATYLLSRSDIDQHQTCDLWGSVLSVACLECDLDMVKMLTAKSIDVNTEDRIGRKPIHFALYRTLDMVEYLIDAGAQLECKDRMGRGPLHFAVVSGDPNIVEFVLRWKPQLVYERDIDDWTPLLWAMRICGRWGTESSERATIIQLLLNHGADPLVEGDGLDRKWTAYGLAAYYNLGDSIMDLVTPTHADLEAMDSEKRVRFQYVLKAEKKRARRRQGSYCDACLMTSYGVRYICDTCYDFLLCFKCYISRNEIHPDHTFSEAQTGWRYVSSEASSVSGTTSDASGSDLGNVDNDSIDSNEEEEEEEEEKKSPEDRTDSEPEDEGRSDEEAIEPEVEET